MTNTEHLDEYWLEYLRNCNVIENEEERLKREKVLILLKSTLTMFTTAVKNENYYKSNVSCELLPFGSYGLGGYIRDADIDIVLVCSQMVKRRDFNKFFPEILKQVATIRDVELISKATVPIIKCVVDKISIDISFVRLQETYFDENINLLDDKYMKNIQETCRASMDGPRVNQFIKNQIKKEHITVFQHSLQCVKHWATVRQIYHKPIGYLNGSSWTLLLLKTYMDVCNVPRLTITQLVCTFFNKWKDWPWPTPVLLTSDIPGENNQRLTFANLPAFSDAVMPIVTPCYPVNSAAPNVTKSTLKIMTREFERASVVLSSETDPRNIVRKIFNPVDYFKRYHDFITIITSTRLQSSCDTWKRKMPNIIPQFVEMLEKSPDLKCIQPVMRPETFAANYHTNEGRRALECGMSAEEAKQLDISGQFNPGMVNLIYFFIGLQVESSCPSLDISDHVSAFEKLLENRRTRHDDDVRWHLTAFKRKKVKEIVFNNA